MLDDAEILDLLLQAGANSYNPDYNLRTPISGISCKTVVSLTSTKVII